MRRIVLALAMCLPMAMPAGAASIVEGSVDFAGEKAEVRYKGQERGNANVYLGHNGLGAGPPERRQQTWDWNDATRRRMVNFTFRFNSLTNTASTIIGNNSRLVFNNFDTMIGAADAVELHVRNNASRTNGAMALTDLVVNGMGIDNSDVAVARGRQKVFAITDFGAPDILIITGKITTALLDTGFDGERVKINIKAGVSAVPVPAALPLLVAGLGALGVVRRKGRKAA